MLREDRLYQPGVAPAYGTRGLLRFQEGVQTLTMSQYIWQAPEEREKNLTLHDFVDRTFQRAWRAYKVAGETVHIEYWYETTDQSTLDLLMYAEEERYLYYAKKGQRVPAEFSL